MITMLIDKKFIKEKSSYMFLEFLKNNEKYRTISHFRRTPAGWLLMHKIMEQYSSDKNLFVEELIKEIPHEVSSRLSIFGLIDSAVKKGILEKKNSNGDTVIEIIADVILFIKDTIKTYESPYNELANEIQIGKKHISELTELRAWIEKQLV